MITQGCSALIILAQDSASIGPALDAAADAGIPVVGYDRMIDDPRTRTKLRAFPKDVMNAAFKASMEFYEELNGKNENWKKVYADYSKFRAEQNLWFRFTEAGFDSFMQAQKL